jgi:acetyl-CoA carboxylase carboxyltransferase component
MNPYIAAEHGYVDKVIIPVETREKIERTFRMLKTKEWGMLNKEMMDIEKVIVMAVAAVAEENGVEPKG